MNSKGFTLIEILVVIIIIGILSAIALPSYLRHTSKARGTEAKIYLRSAIREQQAYYLENSKFTPELSKLALANSTPLYDYKLIELKSNKNNQDAIGIIANPKNNDDWAYVAGIEAIEENENYQVGFASVVCEFKQPGIIVKGEDNLVKIRRRKMKCTEDFREVGR